MGALAPWFAYGRGATDGSIIAIKNVVVDNGDDEKLKQLQRRPTEIMGPEGSQFSSLKKVFGKLDGVLFDKDKPRTLKVSCGACDVM